MNWEIESNDVRKSRTTITYKAQNKKITWQKKTCAGQRKEKKIHEKKRRKRRKYFDCVRWSRVIYAFNSEKGREGERERERAIAVEKVPAVFLKKYINSEFL